MQRHQTTFGLVCAVFATIVILRPVQASAQDAMQSVRELYASAAYEDALSAVGKMEGGGSSSLEAEQYRILCLLALGRMDEATGAVEAVLLAHPEYHPDPAQASPRVQALFADVRRKVGPSLVKRMYQQGRAAMEKKDRADAVAQFEGMLRIANDPDIRNDASIAELKELGSGFLELSKALPAAAAPPDPAPPQSEAPRRSVIVPPSVIQQRLPVWVPDPVGRATEFHGAVRVQISPQGKVVNAEIVKSVHPAYDQALLRAARTWTYEPAKKDGVAIASEKTVEVEVAPPAQKAGSAADKSQPF